ncbi:MAG TPA: Na+/H+ antiporter NhaA [Mycobacteriales bacterium]|nr:Na+/H+ antiporter NhaA [Mycobacteriales bacterium]
MVTTATDEPGQTAAYTRRQVAAPLRAFLSTESGSAGVLVLAILAALVWANIDLGSYESFWRTQFALRVGDHGVSRDLRTWVNSGLMTFFFLVVGLEARREIDLGDLRDRRRLVLPFVGGLFAMAVPVLIYLAINAGHGSAHGWGVAMSTDTALALGGLALLGKRVPDRTRVFLLTLFVVDDLASLVVIGVAYSGSVEIMPILLAVLLLGLMIGMLAIGVDWAPAYLLAGIAMWSALLTSGVDPVVAGLAIGLTAPAYSPARQSLEEASGLFRLFREQPTPELARTAAVRLTSTLSPNARLQRVYHPWTSYAIVPLFGLANAGIALDGGFLADAYRSPVTWGVILGYVAGKPIAILGSSWLVTRLSKGRLRPTVGWAAVAGSGTIGGVGFTVSFLIANLALEGTALAQAKLGVLSAAVLATGLTWVVFRSTALLPAGRRERALLGDAEQLLDLVDPVDEDRDHIRGPGDATVTVVEYGDFQCPYCGQAETAIRAEFETDHDVRYVWRHLPLIDVHPQAQLAAEAAEAAAAQGVFWPMHDVLLTHQEKLAGIDLMRYAREQSLDEARFHDEIMRHVYAARVAQDVETADESGVSGTPTFFINGQRYTGSFSAAGLTAAVAAARARAARGGRSQPQADVRVRTKSRRGLL